jgi:DUF1365 family protein
MNPVSFFYCYDAAHNAVDAVVAEVSNTPWGERHCYVLDTREQLSTSRPFCRLSRIPKEFHVSPFMSMDTEYAWRLSMPGELLFVGIENWSRRRRVFDAQLAMRRVPMTTWQLARVLLRYPVMTAAVYVRIYWQAYRLWRKRAPYFPHPATGRTLEKASEEIRA